MKTNKNKHTIINEQGWTRQFFFSYVTFSLTNNVLIVFNISYSDAIFIIQILTNFNYFITLTITCTRNPRVNFSTRTPVIYYLFFYTHTSIYHNSIFALNYIHFFYLNYIFTHTIHVVSFTHDIKLNLEHILEHIDHQ